MQCAEKMAVMKITWVETHHIPYGLESLSPLGPRPLGSVLTSQSAIFMLYL